MVDCGNQRCSQDRRNFRKELLSWSKKIPILIGIECVLTELAGKQRADSILEQETACKVDDTSVNVQDWEPVATCQFCDSKIDNNFDVLSQLTDSSGELITQTTDECAGLKQLQDLLPYIPQYYTSLAAINGPTDGEQSSPEIASTASRPSSRCQDLETQQQPSSHQQPLLTPSDCDVTVPPQPPVHVALKVPQITIHTSRLKRNGLATGYNKKSYTDEELNAAVAEIQSGKLGTRKASNLYGIPRSTLRNKVFRMASDESRHMLVDEDNTSSDEDTVISLSEACHLPPVPMMTPVQCQQQQSRESISKMTLSDLMQPSPFMLMPPLLLSGYPLAALEFIEAQIKGSEDLWEKKLEQIRKKHNLRGIREMEKTGVIQSLPDPDILSQPFAMELKMTILPELIRRLAEQRLELERQTSVSKLSSTYYHRHMADMMNSGSSEMRSPSDGDEITLKIPSYKPNCNRNETEDFQYKETLPNFDNYSFKKRLDLLPSKNDDIFESHKVRDTLKDIIEKTITEKVLSRTQSLDSHDDNEQGLTTPLSHQAHGISKHIGNRELCSAFSIPRASPSHAKKLKTEAFINKLSDIDSTALSFNRMDSNKNGQQDITTNTALTPSLTKTPIKKTRPKRGQYRKYNSQLLLEAVKAVQRGEMSVHRAGSYYGVPHSTLEYKVKERHLLRQKKVKEAQQTQIATSSSKQANTNAVAAEMVVPSTQSRVTAATTAISQKSGSSTGNGSRRKPSHVRHIKPTTSSPATVSTLNILDNAAETTISEKSIPLPSPSVLDFGHPLIAATPPSLATWLHPAMNGLAFEAPTGLSPFVAGASLCLNTPASELLKKLQQKVQNKAVSSAEDAISAVAAVTTTSLFGGHDASDSAISSGLMHNSILSAATGSSSSLFIK